jgi:uncharacterized protein YeaO (DUF488 family)
MILIKRVYEKFTVTDGKRVLVERLWPRGIRRNTANVDIWLKNVAPTDVLRKWFAHDPKKWVMFKQRYLKELSGNKTFDQLLLIASATDPVTLVYSAKDQKHNSALVLQRYLENALKKKRQKDSAALNNDSQHTHRKPTLFRSGSFTVHKWDT